MNSSSQNATVRTARSVQSQHEAISQVPDVESSDGGDDYDPPRRISASVSSSGSSFTFSTIRKRRRAYNYKTRSKRTTDKSKRHKSWLSMLAISDDEIRLKTCCSTLKCFANVNVQKLRQSMACVFSSSRTTRRSILSQMLTSSGAYYFDGKKVCSIFLVNAFRFSTELQTSVRNSCGCGHHSQLQISTRSELLCQPEPFNSEEVREVVTTPSEIINEEELDTTNHVESDTSKKRDAIITFLNRTATAMANYMPDNIQRHLPYVNKVSVFRRFVSEFNILYPGISTPSINYFYSIWKRYCSDIKVRKATRFTKCSTCERIRKALLDATARNLPTDDLLKEQADHHDFIYQERLQYKSNVELAKLKPLEYLSIVVDGADQSAYTLPHFIFDIKGVNGVGIKVHLIGLLEHAFRSGLQLYTMTDEHQKGSNHIIEVIHRFIDRKAAKGPLPKKLFVQMDNCTRENKNRFVMSYFDALIRWGVFDEIQVGFLPVGHTHCDIDQAFSSTSSRLETHDAVTLEDMHEELRACYNEKTVVMNMKQVVNWSGLCDETNCCNKVDHITHYRFFRLCVSQSKVPCEAANSSTNHASMGSSDSNPLVPEKTIRTTKVMLRHTSRDDWVSMESVNGGVGSFLRYLPDLSQTPPELIVSPDDVDDITSRIQSESQRIDSEEKLERLLCLRDDIYRSRSSKFHWDLSTIVEMQATNLRKEYNEDDLEVAALELSGAAGLSSRMGYDTDSFVAVRGQQSEQMDVELWIGRIVDRINHTDGTVKHLQVHWYERYGDGNFLTGKYRPWFVKNKSTKRKNVPWLSKISCDSVLNCFPTLTSNRKLPMVVANDLRERIPLSIRNRDSV